MAISLFKTNTPVGTMSIYGEVFDYYSFKNKKGKLLDISKLEGTFNKIDYTQNTLLKFFANDKLDGAIIKKNYSQTDFEKLVSKYHQFKFEYQKIGGLVLIIEAQYPGNGHGTALIPFVNVQGDVNRLFVGGNVIDSFGDTAINLPNGLTQPDQSFIPVGRFPRVPTLVVEVAVSQSTISLLTKCFNYFDNPGIQMVIGIKLFPKHMDGSFKAVAFILNRNGLVGNTTSIISFGSQRTTQAEEDQFLFLVNGDSLNLLNGVISTNELVNNTPNTQPFIIDIPLNILLLGANPIPQQIPNTGPNYQIDLHFMKTKLESIPLLVPFTAI